jgi:hypothetical protein
MTKVNTIKILAYQFGGIVSITVRVVIFLCLIPLRISSCEQGVKNSVPFTTGDYVVMGLFGLGVSYLVYTLYTSWKSKPDPFPNTPDTEVTEHKIKIFKLKNLCKKDLGHQPDEIEFQEWYIQKRAERMGLTPIQPTVDLLPQPAVEEKNMEEDHSSSSSSVSDDENTTQDRSDLLNQSFMVEPSRDLSQSVYQEPVFSRVENDLPHPQPDQVVPLQPTQPVVGPTETSFTTVMSPTTRRLYNIPDTYLDPTDEELDDLFGIPTPSRVSTENFRQFGEEDSDPFLNVRLESEYQTKKAVLERLQPRVIPSWEQPRDLSVHPNIFHPELGLENDSTYKICVKDVARAEEILKNAAPEDVLMRQRQLAFAKRELEEYCHDWLQKAANMGFPQPSTLTESTSLDIGIYSWLGGGHA